MKCLGKIFILLFLINNTLLANVKAKVDQSHIVRGEMVTYSLDIEGTGIQRPQITQLCGTDIISTASRTNIAMVNGDYKKTYSLDYTFMPESNCTIEPQKVIVGSKTYTSNAIKIVVSDAKSIKDADFSLELKANKTDLYVGEPFKLTLVFKQRNAAQVVDNKFVAPVFKGFWLKNEAQPQVTRGAEYVTTTLVYTLAPQREGDLKIQPAQMAIAKRSSKRDMWGSFMPQIKWRSYFSNELSVHVKALPNGATLVGDFQISARVDKTQINPNEAVNVTVDVVGDGNLEDIENFKPYIAGVSVFDEKAVIKGNKLSQKIALVADGNFTIPSFSLAYFNTKTQRVEKISTKEIKIQVNGAVPKKELTIKREKQENSLTQTPPTVQTTQNMSIQFAIMIFIGGVIVGVGLMLIRPRKSKRQVSFNYKDEKQLLVKLLPFKDDEEVQDLLDIIESNLYSNKKQSLDKKLVKELLKRYKIA